MKQISGKDLGKAVQRKGWSLARVHGSHHIFTMRGRRERIVIPVHGNRPLKIGLLLALMKIAELTETTLEGIETLELIRVRGEGIQRGS